MLLGRLTPTMPAPGGAVKGLAPLKHGERRVEREQRWTEGGGSDPARA